MAPEVNGIIVKVPVDTTDAAIAQLCEQFQILEPYAYIEVQRADVAKPELSLEFPTEPKKLDRADSQKFYEGRLKEYLR